MISIEIAQEVHKTIITAFGGSPGIRDFNALESALARPFPSPHGVLLTIKNFPTDVCGKQFFWGDTLKRRETQI